MKKWIALLMAALLVLSLTACSSTPSESKPADTAADTPADTAADTEVAIAPDTEADTAPDTTPDTEADTTADTEAEVDFETGTVNGQTYTNDLLGLTLTLDEGWRFLNRDEIDQMMGLTTSLVSDEEIAKSLEEGGAYMDMYAMHEESGATVNINMQKVGLSALLLKEDTVLEEAESSVIAALESMGLSNIVYNIGTMNFAGKEHACADISGEISGATLYEKQVCIFEGTYVASITATSVYENNTDTILGWFEGK